MNYYTCPLCNSPLARRRGYNFHKYLACTNPDCNYTKQTKVTMKIKRTIKRTK